MKVAILGHFAEGKNFCDGQTVKTRMLYDGFCKYSDYDMEKIDSYNWKQHPFRLLFKLRKAVKNSNALVMLPASNGVKVFVPIVNFFNRKYKCKIFYSVIGAWLAKLVENKSKLKKSLKKLDGIWTETNVLKGELAVLGIENVQVIENFKDLEIVRNDKQLIFNEEARRLCTFSRVIKEKGISLAIETISKINETSKISEECSEKKGKYLAKLDIYGPVGENYKQEFFELIDKYSDYVEYKGVVAPENSSKILSEYYCLLFPTLFRTEGIPGTIVDCYFAGTPIIASEWNSAYDILDNEVALVYDFDSFSQGIEKSIREILNINKSEYLQMTEKCYQKAYEYKPENVMEKIKSLVEY